MRKSFDEIRNAIETAFVRHGLREDLAKVCARVHTESTYDGVYSHGTNRVARFCEYLDKGWVDGNAVPVMEQKFGAVRIYNGNRGAGITNALFCCDEGMKLAKENGIAMIGLNNTTHWMRGGAYGKYLAEKGFVGILWTNTESTMPPWGGKEPRVGNNPIIFAMPGNEAGEPLFMDMALSQYSYGKLQVTRLAGKTLPFPGGYNKEGRLTDVPGEIEETKRILPIGYWKGSAFAFMLDVLGAALTNGRGAKEMDAEGKGSCTGCSQVFIVIDPETFADMDELRQKVKEAKDYLKTATRVNMVTDIHAPGEGLKRFHEQHDHDGIFVDDGVWAEIEALAKA